MSQPIVDFQVNGNWQQVFDESRLAVAITDKTHAPIPAFELGFLLDSPILAVRTLSMTAKAHWRFAGVISSRLQLGSGGAASPLPVVTSQKRHLRINRAELHRFVPYTTNYELLVEPAYWLRDLRLTIWQYVGAIEDTTEELIGTVKVDLARIELKIDALSPRGIAPSSNSVGTGFNDPGTSSSLGIV